MQHDRAQNESEAERVAFRTALQREIEAKEKELLSLYERRMAHGYTNSEVSTYFDPIQFTNRKHQIQSSNTAIRAPQLRIRSDLPASPLGGVRTPESVAFTLTGEARHFARTTPQTLQRSVSDADTIASASSSAAAFAVPREFVERLRRLHSSVALHATLPPQRTPRFSLLFSPITAVGTDEDTSYTRLDAPEADLFAEDDVDGRLTEAGALRHVRFSSKSPRVLTFSVERSSPSQNGSADTTGSNADAASHFVNSSDLRLRGGDTCSGTGEAQAAITPGSLAERKSASSSVAATPALHTSDTHNDESLPTSCNSTVLSPRSSIASYLTLIEELRSSLVSTDSRTSQQTSTDANSSAISFRGLASAAATASSVAAACVPTSSGKGGRLESRANDEVEAATPTQREQAADGQADSRSRFIVSSPVVRAAFPSAAEVGLSTHNSPEADVAGDTVSFIGASPIFLQRPERRRRLGGSAAQQDTPAVREAKKKTVHFRASVERIECASAVPPPRPRRRGRKLTQASAPSCAPATVPPEMSVEQRGFGAGISLPCGPTLYFD
ncbi:hypothetical protein N2W54_004499 [Lotmaria passim]